MSLKEVIGLMPAAGWASRLGPIPCSKEVYPVGFYSINNGKDLRPKVVSHYLLENMRSADIRKAYIILRENKWDIPAYFGDGKLVDMHISYLMMDLPYGVPYTLDQAYPFVKDALVALGFPDIMFQPGNAYEDILDRQAETGSDIVLGLFPTDRPHKNDMVELDNNGRIRALDIKPQQTKLTYTWQIAVWTPVFSRYLHDYVSDRKENHDNLKHQKELYVGDIIQAAINDNMQIDYVLFKDGSCLDIGTPEDLRKVIQYTTQG